MKKEIDVKNQQEILKQFHPLATLHQLQTEGAACRRRAESGTLFNLSLMVSVLLMCGGNLRGLASGGSQSEFLNHFYWSSSDAGNGLRDAEYADLKEMQSYYLVALSPLTPQQKSWRRILPPAHQVHFLVFHTFFSLLSSVTRSWKGKLLLVVFLFTLYFRQNFAVIKNSTSPT